MNLRLFCLVLLCCLGCADASSDNRPFLTRTFQTPDGQTAHYVLFVPANRNPAEKLPVILFLNGWGENGDDGLRQISNNFGGDMWRMRGTFPFLAVCPQCTYNAEWTPGSKNANLALDVLDAAIREFNGDPDRVAVTGASTGGTGALNVALANADRFSAIIPISASLHVEPRLLSQSRHAIWNFFNSGDSSSLVRDIRAARKRQLEAGNSPLVTEFRQSGHNAWDSAYSSAALYRWLLTQRRSQPAPFQAFRFLTPETVLAEWTTSDPARWSAEGDDLLGHPGDRPTDLVSPELAGDWAVHLDLALESGQAASIALVDSDGHRAVLDLSLSSDGFVHWTAPGKPALKVDPAAQRALRPGWNDLRLECTRGRITVLFNGWPALNDVEPPGRDSNRCALTAIAGMSPRRFRFLRTSTAAARDSQP